jgi:hypothetical protein
MDNTTPKAAPRSDIADAQRSLTNARTALRCGQIGTVAKQLDAVDAALKAMAKERGL